MVGVGLMIAVGLHLKDLILNLRDLIPDHFVFGHKVAIYILLVDVLLGGGVLYEELFEVF